MEDKQKVEVWEHIPTKRLFRTEESFEKFARQYDIEKILLAKKAEEARTWEARLNGPRLQAKTPQEFIELCGKMWNEWHEQFGARLENIRFTSGLVFDPEIVSSHARPIGKPYRKPDAPNDWDSRYYYHYPGYTTNVRWKYVIFDKAKWSSTINISYPHLETMYRVNTSLKGGYIRGTESKVPGFNTGSGGSRGNDETELQFTIFLDDCPQIKAQFDNLLDESQTVSADVKKRTEEELAWNNKRFKTFEDLPEAMEYTKQLDKLTSELNRITQSLDVTRKSKETFRTEFYDKYIREIDPFDFTVLPQLKARENELRKLINKKAKV